MNLDLMNVEERRELLNAYLDGELSAEGALEVSTWLDTNPGALREVEHLRRLWDLLENYEDEPVSESFAPGVLRAVGIERDAEARRGGRVVQMAWYRRPLATAAAVLVAVGATVLVMSNRETGLPNEPSAVSSSASLEELGVRDLESLEFLDVIVDADDETFNELLADTGLAGAGMGG